MPNTASMIKVLIVDSHPIIATGLKLFFEHGSEIDVVGNVDNGVKIFEFLRRYPVDVIISEIDLPELNGITALRALKKEYHDLKMIMYSHLPEKIYATSVLKAGAAAYVPKSADMFTLQEAILKVYNGGIYLSKKIAQSVNFSKSKLESLKPYQRLSSREIEVLKLLLSGKKNKDIATELNINQKTVSTYKARLFKKLKVSSVVDLINKTKHTPFT